MSTKDTRDSATRRTGRIGQGATQQPQAEELADGGAAPTCATLP